MPVCRSSTLNFACELPHAMTDEFLDRSDVRVGEAHRRRGPKCRNRLAVRCLRVLPAADAYKAASAAARHIHTHAMASLQQQVVAAAAVALLVTALAGAYPAVEQSQQVSSPLLLSRLVAIDPITAAADQPAAALRLARTLHRGGGFGRGCHLCGGGYGGYPRGGYGGFPVRGGGSFSQSSSQSSSGSFGWGRRK